MSAPQHKVIPNTTFVVDGFQYRSPSYTYFLSHAHSDHYTGIREDWNAGLIYCSAVTGKLIQQICGVSAQYIHPLAIGEVHVIQGVSVILVDANHCPGAVQFLFRLPSGERYVHCGDMRYCEAMQADPQLQQFIGADAVFLDTTYCHPKHCFPPQAVSVEAVADLCQSYVQDSPDRLLMIASYTIGKEKIFLEVFRRCGKPIFISDKKRSVLSCIDWPPETPFDAVFTDDPCATRIHAVSWNILGETWPYFRPNFANMESYAAQHNAASAVGFVPTGWTYEMKKADFPVREKDAWKIHLVPYSEHSSFPELQAYVSFLRPKQLIPTVGTGGGDSDKNVRKMLEHFRNLVDTTSAKRSFLAAFGKNGGQDGTSATTAAADDCAANAVSSPGLAVGERLESCQGNPSCLEVADDLEVERCEVKPLARSHVQSPGRCSDSGAGGVAAAATPCAAGDDRKPEASGSKALDHGLSLRVSGAGGATLQDVETVVSVLGGAVDQSAARLLLLKANGSVQRALNLHYDGVAARPSPSKSPGPSSKEQPSKRKPASSKPASGKAASGKAASGKAASSKAASSKAASSKAASTGRSQQSSISSFFAKTTPQQPASQQPSARLSTTIAAALDIDDALDAPHLYTAGPSLSPLQGSADAHMDDREDQPTCAATAGRRSELAADVSDPAPSGGHDEPVVVAAEETSAHEGEPVCKRPRLSASGGNDCAPVVKLPALPHKRKLQHGALGSQPGSQAGTSTAKQEVKPESSSHRSPDRRGERPMEHPVGESTPIKETGRQEEEHCGPACAEQLHGGPAQTQGDPISAGAKARVLTVVSADDGGAEEQTESFMLLPADKFDPQKHACWSSGAMPYLHIALAFAAMETTTKRLQKADVLTNMFHTVMQRAPEALLATTYLAVGKIAPDYEDIQLNIGGSTVVTAIVAATGVTRKRLNEMYVKMGDLGDVAQSCRRNQRTLGRPAPLTAVGVFAKLHEIANQKGSGSAARKQQIIMGLLRSCRSCEMKYLVRTLVQNLRVGANWRSVVGALGRAAALHEATTACKKVALDEAAEIALEAFHKCPNLAAIVETLQGSGLAALASSCVMRPGTPVQPMLAKITNGVQDCVEQLAGAPFLAEFKYDGQRAQIHVWGDGQVKIFSRRCEDKTSMFPDVAASVLEAAAFHERKVSFIIDAELVAVDRTADNAVRAFQDLSTRARGASTEADIKVHVCVFAFDVIYMDGVALLKQPLRTRARALRTLLPHLRPGYVELARGIEVQVTPAAPTLSKPTDPTVQLTESCELHCERNGPIPGLPSAAEASSRPEEPSTSRPALVDLSADACAEGAERIEGAAPAGGSADTDWDIRRFEDASLAVEEVQRFLLEAFAAGTEGLMIKRLDERAAYTPSKRSDSWLKVKKDYCEELRDSLDLVPIGAWYGNGRKAGWFSPFLLAAWDPVREEFQSVCRVMSGFSDDFYAAATARFREHHLLESPKPYYNTGERCDVWFEACEVWEIRGADLTISPVHRAAVGLLHPERGCSLRFPRFIQVREDKGPEDASSPSYICDLFHAQTRKAATAKKQLHSATASRAAGVAGTAAAGTDALDAAASAEADAAAAAEREDSEGSRHGYDASDDGE